MERRFHLFTILMARINRNIRRIKNEEMAEFKLKSTHVSCLYYLYEYGKMTATELCETCDEDKAAISRSVDYLERNGFLCYESCDKKHYKSSIMLTEKGIEVGKRVAGKIQTIIDYAGKDLDDDEREVLYKALGSISDNLQKICDNYS